MSTAATVLASVGTQAEDLVRNAGYVGLAALMVVECVFPPIPSELVLPLAGFEVAQGQLGFPGALLAATAGSLIGAWMIYAIGRFGGRPVVLRLHPLLRVSASDLDRGEDWFRRRGDWLVLGGRLVPGVRSLVSIPAGMLEMPLARFSLLTFAGSAAWNAALIGGGWALGANWERIASIVGPVSTILVAGLAIVGIAGFVHWRRLKLRDAPLGG